MATCNQCGKEVSIWKLHAGGVCKACLSAPADCGTDVETIGGQQIDDVVQPSKLTQVLSRRYLDAYTEAQAVVSVGSIIKGIGLVLAVVVVVGGFVMAQQAHSDTNGMVVAVGFVLGCLVGVPTYVLGILVSAQGQTQLASLDSAVNGSRHLKDDDVAKILSKRFGL